MNRRWIVVALFAAACGTPSTPAPDATVHEVGAPEPAPPGAAAAADGVFFVSPADGSVVTSPLQVVFGIRGMTVAPAGELREGTGHHHLLIDAQTFEPAGTVVPADDQHIHFGKGQTETVIELAPGPHQLALQFADGAHQSYGEAWSAVIHVTVADAPTEAPAGE